MPGSSTTATGYSARSIAVHWIAAILIAALFPTREASPVSAAWAFLVSGGAIAGVFLLWRVWRRVRAGFAAPPPDQHMLFTLAARIVMWGFLACIVVVIVTGYLLPWSVGKPIDIYGLVAIPSPLPVSRAVHEFAEEVHELAGQLFVPLLALHVLGTLKHAIFDKDGVARRMFRAVAGGGKGAVAGGR